MPKATWGSGDEALTAADVDGVETRESNIYTGPTPPSGLYRFVLKSIKKGTSQAGNPKALVFMTLDGTWRKEHAKFEGAPLWDHMPVQKSTAFRVRALTDALGVSAADFLNRMVVDENGFVQKIGKLQIAGEDLLLYSRVERRPATDAYPESLGMPQKGVGYVVVDDGDVEDANDADADADDSDTGDDDEPPF